MSNFVESITQAQLSKNQYVDEIFDKQQIYLHHTASSPDPFGVIEWWQSNKDRIATAFIIAGNSGVMKRWKDGEIVQCFSSKKGAWHLGVSRADLARGEPGSKTSTMLNLNSVGIELCNWGYLIQKNGKFITYEGNAVPENQICEYTTPFRGYKHYQKYTDAQIESMRKLLMYLCDLYSIEKKFKGKEIFDIDKRALRGENGIFTHVSVRVDKFDCHPQPELIQMLESL